MSTSVVMDIAREALWMIIKCSAPPLLVSLVVGLVISVFQTVTSIQEQTLTFVPKILSIFITLVICGGWIMNNLATFMERLIENFSTYVG
jgi:flagellar biosynthetic protein FliQ